MTKLCPSDDIDLRTIRSGWAFAADVVLTSTSPSKFTVTMNGTTAFRKSNDSMLEKTGLALKIQSHKRAQNQDNSRESWMREI